MNCTWSTYEFTVYDYATTEWNDVAGVYIFASVAPQNQWRALYIGQADSFKTRFSSHDRWPEAQRSGAKHVHCLSVPLAANRDTIERQLVRQFQPPLNQHLK